MLSRILRIACFVLPALLLAACGGGAGTGSPEATGSSTMPVATGTPTAAATLTATPTIQASPGLPVLSFSTASGGVARLAVEVEANDADRTRGLMGVTSLPADQGQIFIFQDIAPNQDVQVGFWMQDTLVPLSIAFISADGHVQEIQDMQPETTNTHLPQRPYRYAVEANQGWYARHGVAAGSTVDLSAALARSQTAVSLRS